MFDGVDGLGDVSNCGTETLIGSGSQIASVSQSFYCVLEMVIDVVICGWNADIVR